MHEYDDLGRLTRYHTHDLDYRYTYDQKDRVTSIIDTISNTQTTRTYDPLGNILQETLGNQLTFSNTYDTRGRKIKNTLPDASTINYTYDGIYLHTISYKEHTHTYSQRNLEGQITHTLLPSNTGETHIKRDALGRYTSLITPYYQANYPQYDPTGNLTHHNYQDKLGKTDCHYSYDDLDQLIEENEHTYHFDSLHNRLKKDTHDYKINALCQITHDGKSTYTYDTCGNLISDGIRTYTYDSLDRLIATQEENQRIEYTYDPFHRRLSKSIYIKERKIKHIRYMWDGNNEIGTTDKDHIQELRILGEGLGAEIGAAVLLELFGKPYIPIHDYRGCIVTLVDPQKQTPIECYRYSAFGEEQTEGRLSPWRFSSKRVEEETHLLFFGRRYYNPKLGRWITQDPEGFDDGPNLYAYLSNNPINLVDLYGLTGFDTFFTPYISTGFPNILANSFFNSSSYDYQNFENHFSNKSRNFSLNHDFGFDFPKPLKGAYLLGNGICNSFEDLQEKALLISSFSGYNTRGTYNATHTAIVDVYEAFTNLAYHALTPPINCYHQQWNERFNALPPEVPIWQACHSQGTAQVRNALETYSKERRDRIIVAAFAPLAYISPKLCMKVRHYVCPSDNVPYLDRIGKRKCEETIIYVKRMPRIKQSCHEFLNPIYLPYLKDEIKGYQKLLKEYDH